MSGNFCFCRQLFLGTKNNPCHVIVDDYKIIIGQLEILKFYLGTDAYGIKKFNSEAMQFILFYVLKPRTFRVVTRFVSSVSNLNPNCKPQSCRVLL